MAGDSATLELESEIEGGILSGDEAAPALESGEAPLESGKSSESDIPKFSSIGEYEDWKADQAKKAGEAERAKSAPAKFSVPSLKTVGIDGVDLSKVDPDTRAAIEAAFTKVDGAMRKGQSAMRTQASELQKRLASVLPVPESQPAPPPAKAEPARAPDGKFTAAKEATEERPFAGKSAAELAALHSFIDAKPSDEVSDHDAKTFRAVTAELIARQQEAESSAGSEEASTAEFHRQLGAALDATHETFGKSVPRRLYNEAYNIVYEGVAGTEGMKALGTQAGQTRLFEMVHATAADLRHGGDGDLDYDAKTGEFWPVSIGREAWQNKISPGGSPDPTPANRGAAAPATAQAPAAVPGAVVRRPPLSTGAATTRSGAGARPVAAVRPEHETDQQQAARLLKELRASK